MSVLTSAGAAAVLVLALAACGDSAEPEASVSPSTTVAAASTTSTTAAPVDLSPDQVASDFLNAYGAFDADQALTYLAADAIATGNGHTGSWGSPDAFRSEVSMANARHIFQTVTGCANEGESGNGASVRCGFDLHAFRSDEIGRGPFTDNTWDLVVRDGKVASAEVTWSFLTNGFSAQMWEPFQAWVSSAHPEDLQAMYPVGDPVHTEESMRLWDERLREWAEEVKASSG